MRNKNFTYIFFNIIKNYWKYFSIIFNNTKIFLISLKHFFCVPEVFIIQIKLKQYYFLNMKYNLTLCHYRWLILYNSKFCVTSHCPCDGRTARATAALPVWRPHCPCDCRTARVTAALPVWRPHCPGNRRALQKCGIPCIMESCIKQQELAV